MVGGGGSHPLAQYLKASWWKDFRARQHSLGVDVLFSKLSSTKLSVTSQGQVERCLACMVQNDIVTLLMTSFQALHVIILPWTRSGPHPWQWRPHGTTAILYTRITRVTSFPSWPYPSRFPRWLQVKVLRPSPQLLSKQVPLILNVTTGGMGSATLYPYPEYNSASKVPCDLVTSALSIQKWEYCSVDLHSEWTYCFYPQLRRNIGNGSEPRTAPKTVAFPGRLSLMNPVILKGPNTQPPAF